MFAKLIVLTVFCLAVHPSAGAPQKCSNESVREKCVSSLFLIGGDHHFPNSTQELDLFCSKLKDTDKCIKDYTQKCMTPTGRRAVEVAVAGVSKMLRRMCRSQVKKQEFVKHAKCGNIALPDMRSCFRAYKMSLYGAKQVEVNQKLPILCCKFHEFRGCVRQGFDKLGAEVCPQESRQYYAHIADSFQSDVFDLICSNFEDGSDRCANIVVPKVTPSDDTKSFIKPLRDVLKSILEERNKE